MAGIRDRVGKRKSRLPHVSRRQMLVGPAAFAPRTNHRSLLGANGPRLHELTERLVRMEGHADEIHASGLKRLFREHGETNPTRFLIARELFRHLERVTDSFEDVANEIDGLVIDHA